MTKKPTIAILVVAYNEEANITRLLKSIVRQKQSTYKLDGILLVSDGSTDDTVGLARRLKQKQLKIWSFKKRIGKSGRLNQAYRSINSDILVQTDADVVWSGKNIINHLISPLVKQKQVAMAGGNPLPMKGKTFLEKAVNVSCEPYILLRHQVKRGHNRLSADGRLLAYKRDLFSQFQIPHTMIANDAYTYFHCLCANYEYKFVPEAVVHYRSPQTLSDQISQNTRFLATEKRLRRYFPDSVISQEFYIPYHLFLPALIRSFIKHPLLSIYIFIINRFCQIRALLLESRLTSTWHLAKTTKRLQY